MKKLSIIVICALMLAGMLCMTVSAAKSPVNIFNVTVDTPKAGEMPDYGASVPETASTIVTNVEWKGELDANGCFKGGTSYTMYATVRIKDYYRDTKYIKYVADTVKVNGKTAKLKDISDDKMQAVVYYTFKTDGKAGQSGSQTQTTGTSVSKFNPGDSGKMTLKSGFVNLYDPSNIKQGAVPKHQLTGNVTLEVVEAYIVPSNNAGTFHAVKYKGEVWFARDTDGLFEEFGDFVKYGNNPNRPYHNAHQAQNTEKAVKSIRKNQLIVKEGTAPRLNYSATVSGNEYRLEEITYLSADVSKPYTWEYAYATIKANDGYYFTKDLAVNTTQGDTIIQMNYVDKKTIQIFFSTWVDGSVSDKKVTASMEAYAGRWRDKAYSATPYVATAEVYNPYGDKLLYDYPSMARSGGSQTNTAERSQNKAAVEILAMDLSLYIPDMVGEWYLVRLGHNSIGYMPAESLDNIKLVDYWDGAPGQSKYSIFAFEGGTGTVNDPYLVANANQLNAIRQDLSAHYKLIADIDLSDWGNWVPIGGTPAYGGHHGDSVNTAQHGADYFTGTIDGDGHVISGMQIIINENKPYMFEKGNTRFYGFIASMSSKKKEATVRNLGLVNYKIDVNYNDLTGTTGGNNFFFGAIAGQSLTAHIENCWTSGGTMRFNVNKSDDLQIKAGGLIGEAHKVDVTRCANASDIVMTCCNVIGNTFTAGGIIGQGIQADITECFNSGNITLPKFYDDPSTDSYFFWADSYVGGIAGEIVAVHGTPGYIEKSYFNDCYNTGNLSAQSADNVIVYVGSGAAVYIKNAYGLGKISYNTSDNTCSPEVIRISLCKSAFFTNYSQNGNSVAGSVWERSPSLGRMVLSAIPVDEITVPSVHAPFGNNGEADPHWYNMIRVSKLQHLGIMQKYVAGAEEIAFASSTRQMLTRYLNWYS